MFEMSDGDLLQDILEAAHRVVEYCAGMTYESFLADRKTQDAVARNLEIMGEAAKGISEGMRTRAAHIPWKGIAGMRDRLIHAYFGVNWDVVWDVTQEHLPQIIADLGELADENQ